MPIALGRTPRPLRLAVAAAALVLAAAGCQPAPATSPLTPTGGESGGGSCTTQFSRIQMAGDFTSPGFSLGISPDLIQVAPCVWRVTVTLPAGTTLFKFVTDDAFDNPPDFGGDEAVTLAVPGGPYSAPQVQGSGTAIKVSVAAAGDYTFTLDEGKGTWTAIAGAPPATGGISGTVSFAGLSSPPFPQATVELYSGATRLGVKQSDPATRAYRFDGLDPGSYRVVASANCFGSAENPDVTVGITVVDAGNLALAGGGSAFASIRMVGDFTSPAFSIPISPLLAQITPCQWRATVDLPAGQVLFKFVTNDAFDNPQDYGGSEMDTLTVPGGPHPTMLVSGTGTAIRVKVAAAGSYTITLDEATRTWTADPGAPPPTGAVSGRVTFGAIAVAPYPAITVRLDSMGVVKKTTQSSRSDGSFSFTGLRAGTYGLSAKASGYAATTVSNVVVGVGNVDVGDLVMVDGPSTYLTIDVLGTFNIFTPGVDPMVQGPTATWMRTRYLNAGQYQVKFLTDGSYNDPPDYGAIDNTVVVVPGGGTAYPVTASSGNSITIQVDTPGDYLFVLDERRQAWEIQVVPPRTLGGYR